MKSKGEIVASVTLDTTELDAQVLGLTELLKPTIEGLPNHLVSLLLRKVSAVINDIVVCDSSTAAGTGFNIIHSVRLGAEYERLTAAIRAGEFNLESF